MQDTPKTEAGKLDEQGTIQTLVIMLLDPAQFDEETAHVAARVVMLAGDQLGYFGSDLMAGPERTVDRLRKLSLAEVARLRTVFQQALDALDDLPPEAIKKTQLRPIDGGAG